MLRSVIGAATATALLTIAPPAQADEVHPEWGSIQGQSGVLRKGCHNYGYTYDIKPPTGDWVLEVTISGPERTNLGGGAFLGGYDPEQGSGTYRVCRNSTRYGTFTIKAKLSVDNGPQGYVEGSLPPSQFKLHRPRRR